MAVCACLAACSAPRVSRGTEGCREPEEDTFSFFVLSREAIQRESGSTQGFGGDLGGLEGADAICQRVAESASPCQVHRVWRAFLSTSREDAIDRVGQGPWYDRTGRLVAKTRSDVLHARPLGADPAIVADLPNENGVPNHNPDGVGEVDNHQILTGSGTDGRLYVPPSDVDADASVSHATTACGDGEDWTRDKASCWDWTNAEPKGCPRVGHSWSRFGNDEHWISFWNEGGCAPGGTLEDPWPTYGGPDGSRRVGSAGGYGAWYCFAVTPTR